MRYTDSVYMTLNDAAALRLPKSIKGAVKKERISSVLIIRARIHIIKPCGEAFRRTEKTSLHRDGIYL